MEQSLSYACGRADRPLLYQTIGRCLKQAVDICPEQEAVVACDQGARLTYRELYSRASALAEGLLTLGVKPGDRVGIWSGNRAEWVVSLFGTALANMILVPINPDYRAGELGYALKKVGVKVLLMASAYKKSNYQTILEAAAGGITVTGGVIDAPSLNELERVIYLDAGAPEHAVTFDDACAGGSASARHVLEQIPDLAEPDDPINIQFTSGTTGSPKGATLSHYSLVNNAHLIVQGLRLGQGDRMCIPVPLYHCFGLVLGAIAAIVARATIVLPSEAFDPLATLEAVAKERCAALYGVPTMFIAQLNHPTFSDHDLTCLRTGIIGGAPCPIEVVRRLVSDMHLDGLTIAFGMTETSPASFLTNIDDPLELRVKTVGQVLPYLEVKIIDGEGRIVPTGEVGEVLIRGHAVMLGYWGDEEATAAAIDRGGWMHTGDLGVLDPNGYLRVTGRVKDMIIRGGENIYPREVEELLFTHPDVLSAQVFGVPSDYFGEEVCAWIIVRDGKSLTAEEMSRYCTDRIAPFKMPRHIEFVKSFPMTVTGKPQKFVMKERMQRLLQERVEHRKTTTSAS